MDCFLVTLGSNVFWAKVQVGKSTLNTNATLLKHNLLELETLKQKRKFKY